MEKITYKNNFNHTQQNAEKVKIDSEVHTGVSLSVAAISVEFLYNPLMAQIKHIFSLFFLNACFMELNTNFAFLNDPNKNSVVEYSDCKCKCQKP